MTCFGESLPNGPTMTEAGGKQVPPLACDLCVAAASTVCSLTCNQRTAGC